MEKNQKDQTVEVEEMMYFDPKDRHKYEKYITDENFIVIEDDEGGPTIVTKKYNDEDWDKVEEYFDSHPLFFNDVSADDLDTNEYLQALQAMQYDEEAEVLLEKFYVKYISNNL